MNKRRGIALVSALVFLFITVILVSISSISSFNNRRNAADALRVSQAQLAAEAGLEEGIVRIWFGALGSTFPSSLTPANYQTILNGLGLGPGLTTTPTTATLSNGSSYSYTVQRLPDQGNYTILRIQSTGTLVDNTTRVLEQDITITPDPFPPFAILTNNATCIFCHLDAKSMDAFKGDPTPADPSTWWRKTRIGVLESLITRQVTTSPWGDLSDERPGVVHGSVLTRGRVFKKTTTNGPLVNDQVSDWMETTLVPGDLKINGTTKITPTITDCTTASSCLARQNLYTNYPDETRRSQFAGGVFPDGELPGSFPLPIEDTNGDRKIGDAEWSNALATTADIYPQGSITAPMVQISGSTLSWPTGGSAVRNSSDLSGSPANWIIDGSTNPIVLNKTVFINGNVIIRGKIQGSGTILARGNVYVMGDVTYDCSDKPSLQDVSGKCDYKKYQDPGFPKLSLIAGGNILAGDFVTTATDGSGDDRLTNNRSTQIQNSFASCNSNSGSSNCSWGPNLTLTEIGSFNRLELQKAYREVQRGNTSYKARFYKWDNSDNIYYTTGCAEDSSSYGGYGQISSSGPASVDLCDGNGPQTLSNTNRTAIWNNHSESVLNVFDKQQIKALWLNSINNAKAGTGPQGALRTDGLLYSANSVFALAHPYGPLQGRWDLRGSIVAADTGILATGCCNNPNDWGLRIYHDERLQPRLPATMGLHLLRNQWKVVQAP